MNIDARRCCVHVGVVSAGDVSRDGPADDMVSANLYARNGVGRSAFMFLSSTGNVYDGEAGWASRSQ